MVDNVRQTDTTTVCDSGFDARSLALVGGTAGTVEQTVTVPKAASEFGLVFEIDVDAADSVGAGAWTVRIDVTTGHAEVDWDGVDIRHLNSGCTQQAVMLSETFTAIDLTTAQTYSRVTGSVSSITPSDGDKIVVELQFTNAAPHANRSIGITPSLLIDSQITFASDPAVEVPKAGLALSSVAPGVDQQVAIALLQASVTLASLAPAVTQQLTRAVPQASLVLATTAPSAATGFAVEVPQAPLVLSTLAPVVTADLVAEVPRSSMVLATTGPTVAQSLAVEIPQATLALSTTAPDAFTGLGVQVPRALLSLLGATPTVVVNKVFRPANSAFVLATIAPVISLARIAQVPPAALLLSGAAPTVATTGGAAILHSFGVAAVFDPVHAVAGSFDPTHKTSGTVAA